MEPSPPRKKNARAASQAKHATDSPPKVSPPAQEEPAGLVRRFPPELIGLIVTSFVTRLWMLFLPNNVVFDEVYFKVYSGHYFDGAYYYDSHPPLGKLLIAAFAKIFGVVPADMISDKVMGTAVAARILPAVCGALLVPLVWGILRRLGAKRPLAFLGAFLILADNSLLVESRFVLIDTMLLLFGLGALYLYLIARATEGRRRWIWLGLTALAAGAAASTKWTGLTALALVGLNWLWDQRHDFRDNLRRLGGEVAVLLLVPALLYVGVFWVHFQLLPKTGQGDAFMSNAFQSTLIGSPTYNPKVRVSFPEAFINLNTAMFGANQRMTATHPYGSTWYSWPLEQRGIFYWVGKPNPKGPEGYVYLLGNPLIWWGVWPALFMGLGGLLLKRRELPASTRYALVLIGVAFFMNWVPFVLVTRVMFLYHYFFSFIFSLIFTTVLWDWIIEHVIDPKPAERRIWISVAAVAIVVSVAWIFFAPISYGTPLTGPALQARMWLSTWR